MTGFEPTPRVTLMATSRAADAGHLAAADIAAIAGGAGLDFRLVGGNAISLLVWAHGAGDLVPDRETSDADLGVPAHAAGAPALVEAMTRAGYRQTEGNRFARELDHDDGELTLQIDVLIPSYTGRLETSQPFGNLMVDAIPGLSIAMSRSPTLVDVTAVLTTGTQSTYTVAIPDPISALCLKAYAYQGRFADRDAFDVWRILEVAHKLGLRPSDWPRGASARDAAEILHRYFKSPGATGPTRATTDKLDQTRIRALTTEIVPAPTTD